MKSAIFYLWATEREENSTQANLQNTWEKNKMWHSIHMKSYLMPSNPHPEAPNYFFSNYFSHHSFGAIIMNESFFILPKDGFFLFSAKAYQLIQLMKAKLCFCFLSMSHSGCQPETVLSPKGHLAISTIIFDCYNLGVEWRQLLACSGWGPRAAKYPPIYSAAPYCP